MVQKQKKKILENQYCCAVVVKVNETEIRGQKNTRVIFSLFFSLMLICSFDFLMISLLQK